MGEQHRLPHTSALNYQQSETEHLLISNVLPAVIVRVQTSDQCTPSHLVNLCQVCKSITGLHYPKLFDDCQTFWQSCRCSSVAVQNRGWLALYRLQCMGKGAKCRCEWQQLRWQVMNAHIWVQTTHCQYSWAENWACLIHFCHSYHNRSPTNSVAMFHWANRYPPFVTHTRSHNLTHSHSIDLLTNVLPAVIVHVHTYLISAGHPIWGTCVRCGHQTDTDKTCDSAV